MHSTHKSMQRCGRHISTYRWPLIATHKVNREWAVGFEVQFKEEQDHAKILFNYIISRNGKVELKPINAVPTEWNSLLNLFESTLHHEQKVTDMINDLFALTSAEKDYATQSMLQWFIDEQVEEEENAKTIIDNLKMIKDNGYGIYMLDKELGARKYSQAAQLSEADA